MQKNPDFALSQIVISLANDDLRLNQRDRPVRITPGVDFHFKNGSLCSAGVRPEMSASGLLECPPARISHSAIVKAQRCESFILIKDYPNPNSAARR